jgi:LDH2 family malate/lactate/ureidoglycolate dehydrogenase
VNGRIDSLKLSSFASGILERLGADAAESPRVARNLVWADMCGRHPQGVFRLPVLGRMLRHGLITSPARYAMTVRTEALSHLDAGNGFGQIAGEMAMEQAITSARMQGLGMTTVSNSNHFGAASYYVSLAAGAGCIGMAMTNASPKVAPYGSSTPVFGTNPVAIGFPSPTGDPVLVDFSTAAIAGSTIRNLEAGGGALPEGVALDEAGRPTTSPADLKRGVLLPAAGAKGSGLGMAVEIFSAVLSGAGMSHEVGAYYENWKRSMNIGHAFIAFDIRRFVGMDDFTGRTGNLIRTMKAGRRSGADPVRYPGELRGEQSRISAREGVLLPEETLKAISGLCEELNIDNVLAASEHPHAEHS